MVVVEASPRNNLHRGRVETCSTHEHVDKGIGREEMLCYEAGRWIWFLEDTVHSSRFVVKRSPAFVELPQMVAIVGIRSSGLALSWLGYV